MRVSSPAEWEEAVRPRLVIRLRAVAILRRIAIIALPAVASVVLLPWRHHGNLVAVLVGAVLVGALILGVWPLLILLTRDGALVAPRRRVRDRHARAAGDGAGEDDGGVRQLVLFH